MANTSSKNVVNPKDVYYFRQRQKNKVFQSVIAYFAKLAEHEGLTKKDLAERLQKDPAQITRWFSGPSNWTLDTISDLLLAMDAEMQYSITPFSKAKQDVTVIYLSDKDYVVSSSSATSSDGFSEHIAKTSF